MHVLVCMDSVQTHRLKTHFTQKSYESLERTITLLTLVKGSLPRAKKRSSTSTIRNSSKGRFCKTLQVRGFKWKKETKQPSLGN